MSDLITHLVPVVQADDPRGERRLPGQPGPHTAGDDGWSGRKGDPR